VASSWRSLDAQSWASLRPENPFETPGRPPIQGTPGGRPKAARREGRGEGIQQRKYPYPCGYFNDRARECHCTPPMIQRYVAKVSGPLLDRIDIHIEVPAVQYKELRSGAAAESSALIRARVLAARDRQRQRFASGKEKIFSNAQMSTRQIRTFCELSPDAEKLLERAMLQQGLTARAHDRILKVARTIADLAGDANISVPHIAEAIQYRTLDRSYWAN
jgi:magnesium chelatase family protein